MYESADGQTTGLLGTVARGEHCTTLQLTILKDGAQVGTHVTDLTARRAPRLLCNPGLLIAPHGRASSTFYFLTWAPSNFH